MSEREYADRCVRCEKVIVTTYVDEDEDDIFYCGCGGYRMLEAAFPAYYLYTWDEEAL